MRPLVLIESPYKGAVKLHKAYLRRCFRDSINRGEVPLATHKLYIDVLDDNDPTQRELGMSMMKELIEKTAYSVVYYDLGLSPGMNRGIKYAIEIGKPVYRRSLYNHPAPDTLKDLRHD